MSETMHYDVIIVGAGPAGLSAAIRMKQCAQEAGVDISVGIVEKGSEVGAHVLSGAVLDPRALDELLPGWRQDETCPVMTPVSKDQFYYLTPKKAIALPTPRGMENDGNYIISLGAMCRWLAQKAEALGVDIFPGFSAQQAVFDHEGKVCGIKTGDFGLLKDREEGPSFQPGVEIRAKKVFLSEGCRGSLSEQIIQQFQLRSQPQTYGIGLKEIWRVKSEKLRPGLVVHSLGWPLDGQTYGGGFIYHHADGQVALGLIAGLDYANPYFNPYEEFQRLKTHPFLKDLLEGGERLSYGARALNEGGYQSIPKLTFPGGMLIGCSAGFVDVSKIKGIHNAMKSGMLAAETTMEEMKQSREPFLSYDKRLDASWIGQELYRCRNIRPAFRAGLWCGVMYAALDIYLLQGKAPWTFKHQPDHKALKPAKKFHQGPAFKPDGVLTFDRLSSVALTGTMHRHDEPGHLILKDSAVAIEVNWKSYASPEQRYCPAGVYEIIEQDGGDARLQINAQNCIHCKTCDIKDPTQNITWVPPEGGGGPRYGAM